MTATAGANPKKAPAALAVAPFILIAIRSRTMVGG
jgi:hypothetical protein